MFSAIFPENIDVFVLQFTPRIIEWFAKLKQALNSSFSLVLYRIFKISCKIDLGTESSSKVDMFSANFSPNIEVFVLQFTPRNIEEFSKTKLWLDLVLSLVSLRLFQSQVKVH